MWIALRFSWDTSHSSHTRMQSLPQDYSNMHKNIIHSLPINTDTYNGGILPGPLAHTCVYICVHAADPRSTGTLYTCENTCDSDYIASWVIEVRGHSISEYVHSQMTHTLYTLALWQQSRLLSGSRTVLILVGSLLKVEREPHKTCTTS